MEKKIWIIDDDLVSQFATQYRIEQSNISCSISMYDNAEVVLKILLDQPTNNQEVPEIILLDLVMPGMDGWEFLKELEEKYNSKNKIKVYVLSAFTNYKDRDLAKEHPLVHGYFDKPLSKVDVDKIF